MRRRVCERCGLVFDAANSDESARAELEETVVMTAAEREELEAGRIAVFCDDCWAEFLVWARPLGLLKGEAE